MCTDLYISLKLQLWLGDYGKISYMTTQERTFVDISTGIVRYSIFSPARSEKTYINEISNEISLLITACILRGSKFL